MSPGTTGAFILHQVMWGGQREGNRERERGGGREKDGEREMQDGKEGLLEVRRSISISPSNE